MPMLSLANDVGNKIAQITMPVPDNQRSVLAIAYHKSGSVLLDGILRELCNNYGRSYVRLDSDLFAAGYHIKDFDKAVTGSFSAIGYVYGVFRTYLNAFSKPPANQMVRLMLIRDPRDAIVSYYFSVVHSHSIPVAGEVQNSLLAHRYALASENINKIIMSNELAFVFDNMNKIASLVRQPGSVVYRYEDIIFSKAAWIRDVASRILVEVDDELISKLVRRFDIRPEIENVKDHIRQVTPGDYKKKLSSQAIDYLEMRHADLLQQLGYLPTIKS